MRFFLICLFFLPLLVLAHLPAVVDPQNVDDVIVVEQPEISFAYYGELKGFPHTYEINATDTFTLYTQILEPDYNEPLKNHSVIIVRQRDNGRGVEEVMRLPAADGPWEPWFEPFGGDRYLLGPEYEALLGPGVYRIEVSTPSNSGKYALAIGKIEDFSDLGYFGTIARIYEVKRFLGKSPLAIFETPFVYVPTILVILLVLGIYWYRKRHA